MIEVTTNPIYLPAIVKTIDYVELYIILYQDGYLVSFRGETITVQSYIKSE